MVKNKRSHQKTLAALGAMRSYIRKALLLKLRLYQQRRTQHRRQWVRTRHKDAATGLTSGYKFRQQLLSTVQGVFNKLKLRKFPLLLAGTIFLVALAVVAVSKATTQTNRFYGVKFPAGETSFADVVVSYDPIIYLDGDRPNVEDPFNKPLSALGAPNSSNLQHPLPSLAERDDVALGMGGSITLQFTDNLLTGSGNDAPDLWIFEAGGVTESVLVEISQDGETWHSVGKTTRDQSGIDLDAFGWGPQDFFSYVRLSDDPQEGEHEGIWKNGEWLGWGGANIDAVGAISSASFERSAPNILSSPPSISYLVFLVLIVLVPGLVATGYFFNGRKKRNR